MFKTTWRWRLVHCLCAALLLFTPAILADDDDDDEARFHPEGDWMAVIYAGSAANGGSMGTIVKVDSHRYSMIPTGTFVPRLNPALQIPGIPVTDTRTPFSVQFKRVGKNEYEATSVQWYGDSQSLEDQKTVWAQVCNGYMTQLGEDELRTEWYCSGSCNPCYPGCWNYGLGLCDEGRLWDPFEDPTSICFGGPYVTIFQRIPMTMDCVP